MASALPRFAVIQSINHPENYLRYTSEDGELHGVLQVTGEEIVSPYSKFEIVRASDGIFVNIRCCYNNKYWVAQSSSDNSYIIVAGADEPHEDQSQLSCTLFELVLSTSSSSTTNYTTTVLFRHVQLGRYLSLVPSSAHGRALYADSDGGDVFGLIDWESLVILPKHVAFKGDNGKYLKAYSYKGHAHLQFALNDSGDPLVAHEVFMTKDGRVRIKNNLWGKFWRLGGAGWIVANSDDTTTDNPDTLFTPVKIGDNVIGLRSVGNKKFCSRFTDSYKTDCLSTWEKSSLSTEARLVVEELVIARQIYNVKFRLLDARIYDEKTITMVTKSVINNTSVPETVNIRLVRQETRSSTWKSSVSLKLGVKTSVSAGVPGIAEEKVEYSAEITGAYEWGETVTTETQVESEYTTTVPPMTKITVSLLATEASCDVPFSYTQRDTLMNGEQVISNHDDGLYTGINSFNFHYETKEEKL